MPLSAKQCVAGFAQDALRVAAVVTAQPARMQTGVGEEHITRHPGAQCKAGSIHPADDAGDLPAFAHAKTGRHESVIQRKQIRKIVIANEERPFRISLHASAQP